MRKMAKGALLNHLLKDITVHFIGIGGIGMSGIAEVLLSQGVRVTGSDVAESLTTQRLRDLGVSISIGHKKENIGEASIIVHTSAIKQDNPELVEARLTNRPTMRRAEMLAELMKLKHGLAVGGTHGKTTTTSFLATILKESKLDPTYIIGGVVKNLNGHARVGEGQYLVAEADESDGSFLLLNPIMSLITNIDNDHLDHYGSEEALENAFTEFANKVPFYGLAVLNGSDVNVKKLIPKMKRPYITFGIKGNDDYFDYEADELSQTIDGVQYTLKIRGENFGQVKIQLPGRHNVLNSLGAIALAHSLGVDLSLIIKGVEKFEGVGRRFQKVYDDNDLIVIDDYGHHPTEISETIKTALSIKGQRRLVVFFEPHRYTRTKDCWDQFLHCFNGADELFLSPIYPASEKEIPGINSTALVEDINRLHPGLANDLPSTEEFKTCLKKFKGRSTLILCMGAGSIGKIVKEGLAAL